MILLTLIGLTSFSQNVNNAEKFKTTKVIRDVGDIKVIILQIKSLVNNPEIPLCRAEIIVLKKDRILDSIEFSNIDAVGGNYGLYIDNNLIDGHLIISKYGDYDGLTLIINNHGHIFKTVGGRSFVDNSSGLLFSDYDSDLAGLSVFDLNNDREIMEIIDMEDRPAIFFKTTNNKYYFQGINDETEKLSLWEIDIVKKKINKIEVELPQDKMIKLRQLADYQLLDVTCE